MLYNVEFTENARKGLGKLYKDDPKCYKKALAFIKEIEEHPRTGTGHPEPLKGDPADRWSRRISKKHRLVYRIFDTDVVVLLISAYGHYEDR